jgi:SHS2 domain-containing protein
MSSARFELVEHTADVGIRGWAPTLPELFRVMARGLFAVIVDPASVEPRNERRFHLEAGSPEDLLHEWLEELNSLHQIRNELYGRFEPHLAGNRLEALVAGEPIDFLRHDLRVEVKAVTWHELRIERTIEGYEAFVLLDI